ncbi:undecaprenyldiphospho-muramoylpentapeptide beta-N-acetylglucosaminyltransferase [Candidatus Trichorickettsia mobilis]|uniref:undecaprenyldiphospho-muramoylpentapeptide beta-N-acetylglucosaminyltransferase n=1 Tax=Candidatus Trichorickettsia mobilis TaxID=1346319 RepID=UPI00292EC1A7|nr:undecaprenyldiphospho-muramoylpentapeptide beta-N-acetylglucosaminyltransferase [Candidatus Trichorickettsia mobilis]
MKKSIILAAGGTGGHLFPAIALGEELIKRGYTVHLITDLRCQKYLTSDLKLITHVIDFKLDTKSLLTKIKSVMRMMLSTLKALLVIVKNNASIIIGFGGYPSFPPMLAGILARIPLVIHEQNCFMGKTNITLARFAKVIALSYQETKNVSHYQDKIVITGDIIRNHIRNIPTKNNFNNVLFRILVIGGSQGARIFSTLIPESITILMTQHPNIKLQVTQQVLKEDYDAVNSLYASLGISYQLSDFFHNIAELYGNSELIIARAGASTIAELTTIGLPAIFIPFPHAAENHQFYNAQAVQNQKAGWCFEQHSVTPTQIANKIFELISDRSILTSTSRNLLQRKSKGHKILADTVEKIITC